MDEKIDLSYYEVRKVANGWVLSLSGRENDFMRIIQDRMFVFRTLDEMFAWIRAST